MGLSSLLFATPAAVFCRLCTYAFRSNRRTPTVAGRNSAHRRTTAGSKRRTVPTPVCRPIVFRHRRSYPCPTMTHSSSLPNPRGSATATTGSREVASRFLPSADMPSCLRGPSCRCTTPPTRLARLCSRDTRRPQGRKTQGGAEKGCSLLLAAEKEGKAGMPQEVAQA